MPLPKNFRVLAEHARKEHGLNLSELQCGKEHSGLVAEHARKEHGLNLSELQCGKEHSGLVLVKSGLNPHKLVRAIHESATVANLRARRLHKHSRSGLNVHVFEVANGKDVMGAAAALLERGLAKSSEKNGLDLFNINRISLDESHVELTLGLKPGRSFNQRIWGTLKREAINPLLESLGLSSKMPETAPTTSEIKVKLGFGPAWSGIPYSKNGRSLPRRK